MTIHVKPDALIASRDTGATATAHAGGSQGTQRAFLELLPFLIFCFGMLIAAVPMMLGS